MFSSHSAIRAQKGIESTIFNYFYHIPKTPVLDKAVSVHVAKTTEDLNKVFNIRWEGYKKYSFKKGEIIDEYDFSPNVTLLLAEDNYGNAVGTLRILDRRFGEIELDKFVEVDSFVSEEEGNCVEATRFSIPNHPDSKLIKHLLWKALLSYCLIGRVNVIIYSVRPQASRVYRRLLFENVGPYGVYNHPLLEDSEHHTYKCVISEKRGVLKRIDPPLYNFFFKEDHPNILMD
ncbi:MAG: N-acyl amino acid synthase FeeM domain-containing protein [bacterium]